MILLSRSIGHRVRERVAPVPSVPGVAIWSWTALRPQVGCRLACWLSEAGDIIESMFDLAMVSVMLGRLLMYLSSYAPLFGLLAVRFTGPGLWVPCLVLAVAGAAAAGLLLLLDGRSSRGPHKLASVRDAGGEAAAYLASYLLPFLTVATPGWRDIAAYVGFLAVAAVISVRSPAAQVNPLLYLFGYRVLSVTDDQGLQAYLITRQVPLAGQRVLATRFRNDVLISRSAAATLDD